MNRLRIARELAGVRSVSELARRTGIERTTLSRIENGHTWLNEHLAERIAAAIGCQPGDLFSAPPEHEAQAASIARRLASTDEPALRSWLDLGRRLSS